VAWEVLGNTIYNIAFLGYEGSTGWANGSFPEMELERPPRDSLEDLWGETSHDNAFVDLRHVAAGGEWLKTRLTARPVDAKPIVADMSQLFDAAVFLRSMEPSRRGKEPPSAGGFYLDGHFHWGRRALKVPLMVFPLHFP